MEENQPIYKQVHQYILKQIKQNVWKPGDKIPTEKELMEQFDVSRITISTALANLSKEGWISRIQGKGSYVLDKRPDEQENTDEPADIAVPMHNVGNGGFIGVIMLSMEDYFSIRLFKGITDAIMADGDRRLVMMQSYNSPEREADAIRDMLRKGAEGLIIFPADTGSYSEEVLRLKLQRFPLVIIDRYLMGVETHYIGSDGVAGAQKAVSHLYDLGHRDIAICSDSPLSLTSVEQRIQGYMKELKERGELINPALMLTDFYVVYDEPELDLEHPLCRYIRNGMATAYITINGKLALHMIRIARQLNLEVPRDFSLVTFDNPMPSREFAFFTYIDQREYEVGKRAAGALLDLLNKQARGQPAEFVKMFIEPDLVAGESTAALGDTKRRHL
ncbi:GntR family transcriptional regulator [Cohnella nanjingensis]|uniref:GntR family transcriptional regulator n=1 Tax=Cohnella nanjingensis TaxID=1387779 RepID=A0A7X0RVQ9_9BACL|nr:GntR family transcriptional regulator [Cohnella nanjingensis]MBB6674568.1 GntR family transcriptional regulator [Cohnella nanjingensis]